MGLWHYYVLHFSLFSHHYTITMYYNEMSLLHYVNYYVLRPLLPLLCTTFQGNLQMIGRNMAILHNLRILHVTNI
jgi:hypothetical protein